MEYDVKTWIEVSAYMGGGLAIGLGALGAAIGEGHAAQNASIAVSRNPGNSSEILRTMLVGQAIAESAAIFALVISLILLFSDYSSQSILMVFVVISAGIGMGLGAIGSGIGSGYSAGAACIGISRQPKATGPLTTNMLIGSAVCQTPSIFALVTSFILLYSDYSTRALSPTWAAILGAGFAVGLGAIGSGLGGGFIAKSAVEGIAIQPGSADTTTSTMLLGQAVTQTTAIYGLLVSFILIFKVSAATDIASAMALLGAGLCMGFGAIGPGLGVGIASSDAVKWIARNEKATAEITRVMLVGMAVTESTGIYALVISLVLIFVI